MKPFSPFKFFIENKKKALVSFIVLIFTVCSISLITALINSIPDTVNDVNLKPMEYYSGVYAVNGQKHLKDDIITHLKSDSNIERLVDGDYNNTSVNLAIGGNTSVPIPTMKKDDIVYMLDGTGDKITEGRLPQDGQNELVVHWRVMKNKGWHINDFVGKEIDKSEWLNGKYKIVGVIDGPVIMGAGTQQPIIVNDEDNAKITHDKDTVKPSFYLIFFKDGQRKQVNDYLATIPGSDAGAFYYEETKESIDKSLGGLNTTLFIIIIVVVFILSISVSALMYIVYFQRSDEFGIMYAIGYTRRFIRRMISKEIMSLNILGWLLGLAFSILVVAILNALVYTPKGNVISIYSIKVLLYTAIIPIIIALCSIFPITHKLRKWDPVAIIERRE